MAVYSPRLWWVAIALLLWAPHTHCREFTHDDIREAMLSLVHMIRMSEDKLERHELREKALGEQIKKMLNNLDKKHRTLEPLKGMIARLDDRLSNVETIILQKEEREKSSQVKLNEVLSDIHNTLESFKSMQLDKKETTNKEQYIPMNLQNQLDATNIKIDALIQHVKSVKNSINSDSIRSMCIEISRGNEEPLEKHLTEAAKLLNKYDSKLNEYTDKQNSFPTNIIPLSNVAVADEAWHCNVTEVLEDNGSQLKIMKDMIIKTQNKLKDIPNQKDLQHFATAILETVVNSTSTVIVSQDSGVNKVATKLREMGDRLVATNEDIQKSLTQSNTMTEHAYSDISRSYETLHSEVLLMSKNDQMVRNMSDNVLYIKKRLEYGVHQIVMQLSEVVRGQHKQANHTVDLRLSNLEATLINNQTRTLENLSRTIEGEMSQVWRQIGIMHRQILVTHQSLNLLNVNTEHYLNSSTNTMNKVKNEVDGITTRIVDLGENVNYVLGKLSVVTQEFKIMATGLNAALQKLNLNASALSTKTEDGGPGPHRIISDNYD